MPTSKKRVKKVPREPKAPETGDGVEGADSSEAPKAPPKEVGFGFAAARRQGGKPKAAPAPKMMRGRGANRGR